MSRDDDLTPAHPRASKYDDAVGAASQTSDQVQESAQALIQLAQGGLGYAESTSEDHSPAARRRSKSQLTSQRLIEDATKRIQARRIKGQQKKQARAEGRAEAAKAIAALTIDGSWTNLQSHDHSDRDRSDPAPQLPNESTLPSSSHPLDEVSTDDETPNVGMEAVNLDVPIVLPSYTPSQRRAAIRNASSERNPPKNKRRKLSARRNGVVDQSRVPGEVLQSVEPADEREGVNESDDYVPSQGYGESSEAERQRDLQLSTPEMFIDPHLERTQSDQHTSRRRSPIRLREPGVAKIPPRDTTKRRTRRPTKKQPPAGLIGQEYDYISPYVNTIQLAEYQVPAHTTAVSEERTGDGVAAGDHGNEPPLSQNNFGDAEINRIERFRDVWCQRNARQPHEFNELIQSNLRATREAVEIFGELQEMFPHHKPIYIQRFCRRKFHNFSARGTWTLEEEEELCRAVAEKGTSWKGVGQLMNRFPEDCRDRWRNYLSTPERRNHDLWTEAEVRSLARCIFDCFCERFMDRWEQETDMSGYFPPAGPEIDLNDLDMKFMNWQAVSDRMLELGLRRTRLQCSYKWSKTKPVEQNRLLEIAQERRRNNDVAFIDQDENHTSGGYGWRAEYAKKRAQRMLQGDKMDLLDALLSCGARSEEAITWKTLGPDWFQRRWSTAERKFAWLELKESLQASESDDYRYVARLLLGQFHGSERDERWDSSQEQEPKKRRYRKKKLTASEGTTTSIPHDHVTAGRAARSHRRQPSPREVIEIDSNDDNDDYQPPVDVANSENLASLDSLFSDRPRTRRQTAAFNPSTPLYGRTTTEGQVDMVFELPPASTIAGTEGEISPRLTRQLMALQHA